MSMESSSLNRFWEIDFLRGAAIIMMVISNLITDLNYFNVYASNAFWFWFARATAFIFIFLVGGSLTLSYSRVAREKTQRELCIRYLKRGAKIFFWGLIITAVTWLFMRSGFVVFGVLHLIGVSIPLGYLFLRQRLHYAALVLGIAFIALGIWLRGFVFDFPWLLWLGFFPQGFYTVDYFPLLPWLGVVLLGIFFGNLFYPNYTRAFKLKDFSYCRLVKSFCFLGKHSLFIYLLHQPILIGALWALGIANPLF